MCVAELRGSYRTIITICRWYHGVALSGNKPIAAFTWPAPAELNLPLYGPHQKVPVVRYMKEWRIWRMESVYASKKKKKNVMQKFSLHFRLKERLLSVGLDAGEVRFFFLTKEGKEQTNPVGWAENRIYNWLKYFTPLHVASSSLQKMMRVLKEKSRF